MSFGAGRKLLVCPVRRHEVEQPPADAEAFAAPRQFAVEVLRPERRRVHAEGTTHVGSWRHSDTARTDLDVERRGLHGGTVEFGGVEASCATEPETTVVETDGLPGTTTGELYESDGLVVRASRALVGRLRPSVDQRADDQVEVGDLVRRGDRTPVDTGRRGWGLPGDRAQQFLQGGRCRSSDDVDVGVAMGGAHDDIHRHETRTAGPGGAAPVAATGPAGEVSRRICSSPCSNLPKKGCGGAEAHTRAEGGRSGQRLSDDRFDAPVESPAGDGAAEYDGFVMAIGQTLDTVTWRQTVASVVAVAMALAGLVFVLRADGLPAVDAASSRGHALGRARTEQPGRARRRVRRSAARESRSRRREQRVLRRGGCRSGVRPR